MGCCFCCLGEGEKVDRVLAKFEPAPVSRAVDNNLMKVVGRVSLAGPNMFYAPGSGKPCVWFHTVVSEERIEKERDANGNMKTRKKWVKIAEQERFVDFYLQDGAARVFVQGSQRGLCRIQSSSEGNTSRNNVFDQPPPGIQMMIAQNNQGFSWGGGDKKTGRYRYTEQSFDVNELVAALGVIRPAVDPYTQQPVKFLQAFAADTLNEEYFDANEWEDWDRRSWADLCKEPAVLLSDSPKFTGGVQVPPIQNLPPQMVQPAQNPDQMRHMWG